MKVSTRARYGLRLMVELARELQKEDIVQLNRIAKITHLSENYLAQLAIPLKEAGLIVGVSGKKGGYLLGRIPEGIKIKDIINALIGPIGLTDCVNSPEVCLNYSFCEARMIWTILSGRIQEILDEFTLADLIDKDKVNAIRKEYSRMAFLNPDLVLAESDTETTDICPPAKNRLKLNVRKQNNCLNKGFGK
ncbi:MAG: Rrf2 family transcriptional regulator [Candidatus Zixiibacteriota bacterium]|nr:MAG: Rrf2 family transcriptional regulator [candidate division Zixibacteria bacterium]